MNKISKRSNNFSGIFHKLIIAMFLLGLSGCGYKAPPFYLEDAPEGDENVTFTIKKAGVDNNTSAVCEPKK